jgi:hypothetical protein
MNKQKPAHGEKSLTSNLCLESGMGLVVYKCKEYKEEGKGFTSRILSGSIHVIITNTQMKLSLKVTLSLRSSLTL